MAETIPCAICGAPAEISSDRARDITHRCCPRCGEFWLTYEAAKSIDSSSDELTAKLSGWVRNQNILGEVPELTDDRIERVAAIQMPGLIERANRLLSFAIRRNPKLGGMINFHDSAYIAVSYSKDIEEVDFLLGYLRERGFFQHEAMGGNESISFEGHAHYEKLQAKQPVSTQGFVAMWFDGSMNDAYQLGCEPGIRAAGYDPVRVDQMEHIGKIDDEIIAQIRRSRFIVADFTGHRSGVYFEAGFALGLNLPVFWTCRKDMIDDLHFDIRQFNCIVWESPQDLAKRLKVRIEAVIGMGPRNL